MKTIYTGRLTPFSQLQKKMWFKIPVIQRENEDQRTKVNSAIYRAIQMRKYYKDENLEGKSQDARRKALSRKMKVILKQVDWISHFSVFYFFFLLANSTRVD